ncbi:MAG: hypothetical protein HZB75_00435 [Candidatus Saccharibacteria bacterium]|jgi:hypothetical protein|nr:MAG: hypothetical protein HZB75_00435 [Candidatus Saccharibacteria bacterium]
MKRFLIIIAAFAVTVAGSFAAMQSTASAEDVLMTEAHIARIRANCVDAQSSLRQLHASDALLRVNRGQVYESMSTKLMATFNSRVALNRLDGLKLVSIAAQYETQLMNFRQNYQSYEESMSGLLKLNCINQPVAFYDSVAATRAMRKKVHDSTLSLHKTIRDYKNEFELFAKQFEGVK